MQTFYLHRLEDESGISGTGVVAEGVQFASGKCVLAWVTPGRSVGVYDSLAEVERIHGHNGKTKIVWGEDSMYHIPSAAELGKNIRSYRMVNGLSQSAFAKRAGLSRNCIALLEGSNGRTNNLSVDTINRVIQAMHASDGCTRRNALLHALFANSQDS